MELQFVCTSRRDLDSLTSKRDGETKLGQVITAPVSSDLRAALSTAASAGVRYVVLGIPEDIGPRANLGRGGAHAAWPAFLSHFLNVQANQFFDPARIAVLGAVAVDHLMSEASRIDPHGSTYVPALRALCQRIDERVQPVIREIVAAGLEPIVIGGGHNNALPIIQGVSEALGAPIGCVNCDPHADFRALEGRHSGNGFSYAAEQKSLDAYYVLGLHESYNGADLLRRFQERGFGFRTYEEIKVRGEMSWESAIADAIEFFGTASRRVGIELDLDAIAGMPASAMTSFGISNEEAARYLFTAASRLDAAYLHLPEGAPEHGPDGARTVGRSLALHVLSYIKGREAAA